MLSLYPEKGRRRKIILRDGLALHEKLKPIQSSSCFQQVRRLSSKFLANLSMPEYKLTYFNCKGLGEAIRFLFAYGDINFDDNRIEERDWVKVKKSEWNAKAFAIN